MPFLCLSDSILAEKRLVRMRERETLVETDRGERERDGQTGRGLLRVRAAQNSAADRQHCACPGVIAAINVVSVSFEPVSQRRFTFLVLSTAASKQVLV